MFQVNYSKIDFNIDVFVTYALWFAGVFIDEEEDSVLEEPIAELGQLLENLVSAHYSECASDSSGAASEILPLLSKVYSKVEEMMKSLDAKFQGSSYIILDKQLYDKNLIAFQVWLFSLLNLMKEWYI